MNISLFGWVTPILWSEGGKHKCNTNSFYNSLTDILMAQSNQSFSLWWGFETIYNFADCFPRGLTSYLRSLLPVQLLITFCCQTFWLSWLLDGTVPFIEILSCLHLQMSSRSHDNKTFHWQALSLISGRAEAQPVDVFSSKQWLRVLLGTLDSFLGKKRRKICLGLNWLHVLGWVMLGPRDCWTVCLLHGHFNKKQPKSTTYQRAVLH